MVIQDHQRHYRLVIILWQLLVLIRRALIMYLKVWFHLQLVVSCFHPQQLAWFIQLESIP